MSRTYRKKPSSGAYFRRMASHRHLKTELSSSEALLEFEEVAAHRNRSAAFRDRVANSRQDKVVSHYRGQSWHRNPSEKSTKKSQQMAQDLFLESLLEGMENPVLTIPLGEIESSDEFMDWINSLAA